MLIVELQFVESCPRVIEMRTNLEKAISSLDFEIEYVETKIDSHQSSKVYRGCPTLLVNDRDFEGEVDFRIGEPFCRIYNEGIPSTKEIIKFLMWNY